MVNPNKDGRYKIACHPNSLQMVVVNPNKDGRYKSDDQAKRKQELWLTPIKMVDTRGVRGYRLLLKKEQREVVSATNQLKLTAPDGKQLRLRNMAKTTLNGYLTA